MNMPAAIGGAHRYIFLGPPTFPRGRSQLGAQRTLRADSAKPLLPSGMSFPPRSSYPLLLSKTECPSAGAIRNRAMLLRFGTTARGPRPLRDQYVQGMRG